MEGEVANPDEIDAKSLSDNKKLEFLKTKFTDVNDNDIVLVDYSCALQSDVVIQGRVYLTLCGLYFHANICGFITQAKFNWNEVLSIKRENAAFFLPIAIHITTKTEKFMLSFMSNRDKIFTAIVRICKSAVAEIPDSLETLMKVVSLSINTDSPKSPNKVEHSEMEIYDRSDNHCKISQENLGEIKTDISSVESSSSLSPTSESKGRASCKTHKPNSLSLSAIHFSNDSIHNMTLLQNRCECNCCGSDCKEIISTVLNASIPSLRNLMFSIDSPLFKSFAKQMDLQNLSSTNEPVDKNGCDVSTISYILPMGFPLPSVSTKVTQTFSPSGTWEDESHCCVIASGQSQNVPYSDCFQGIVTYCFTHQSPTSTQLKIYLRLNYVKYVSPLMKGIISSRSITKTEEYIKTLMKFVTTNISSSSANTSGIELASKTSKTPTNSIDPIIVECSPHSKYSLSNSLSEARKVFATTVEKILELILRFPFQFCLSLIVIFLIVNQIYFFGILQKIIANQQKQFEQMIHTSDTVLALADKYLTNVIAVTHKCSVDNYSSIRPPI